MNVFSRSWGIAKLSFGVINKDKEMLAFPLLAGIFSLLYMVALLFPTVVTDFMNVPEDGEVVLSIYQYLVLFATYLGLSFIATFFNTCVVYTTKVRFEGGDATFMESIKFAFSKIELILAWSLVAATVGILLHAIDRAAERLGGLGQIVVGILRSLLGMVWSVVTIFVVPAMVYHDLGPIDAIKKSAATVRDTWGESLIRHYGMGMISTAFILLGIAGTVGATMVLPNALGQEAFIPIFAVAGIYFLGVILVFNCANTVFNTALYVYASQGEASAGFDSDVLRDAFRERD